jgi:uncharacterized protein YehS (DUF1456 family)
VDVAKDPYIMKIITSDLAVGTFMFLQRVGVPLKTAAMFMNQPIIKKYLEMLDSEGKRTLFDGEAVSAVKMLFGDTTTDLLMEVGVNTENLEGNIEKYYSGKELTQTENAEQQNALNEFLKYAKMAEYNFKFTQAINYDTTSFRNAESLFKKEMLTDTAVETNIISSVDDVLNNSFLGRQKKLLGLSSNAIGAILTLDKFAFRVITNDVLRRFAKKEFFSQDDYDRVANKIKASFLDFVIQTKTGLNKEVEALLVNASTSVAAKLEQAKKDFPNNQLLKDLQVTSSPRMDSAKTVKLAVNVKEAYDENLYTGYMRELRDNPATRDLYYDIVMTSILQGTYQSAISIRNIIPIEDFSETVAPVIQSLVSDPTVEAFSKSAWFERNNWNDEDVMPTVTPSFFFPINKSTREIEDSPISIDQYGNEIFKYISPSYVDIKGLNVVEKDRKILLLGEKYNFKDVQNEFIKVPKLIQRKDGSYINVMTGVTITGPTIKKMREKGDLSFRDYLGYQKVRDGYGNPVVASIDKEKNQTYVYKLINLYGDGMYASEYYSDLKPSPLNNGTEKIENEIPNSDIIAYYGENVPVEQIAVSQPTVPAVAPAQQPTSVKQAIEAEKQEITKRMADVINDSAKHHLPKEQFKTKQATQYIGEGATNSSTDNYKKLYAEYGLANTGNYNSLDLIYVSSNGNRGGRVNPVQNGVLQAAYKNIDKAIAAGARFIMDTAAHIEKTKSYNIGEIALAEYLTSKGYVREDKTGIWSPTQPSTSVEGAEAVSNEIKTVSPEVEVGKDIQDIIYKSNLEPGEYEVVEINGKQRVIDKRFVPERVKKGFSKFYSTYDQKTFIEKYGKKVILPGFEDINLMMEQDSNEVYELSTGLRVPTTSATQKEIKKEVERLFEEKNIRKILANSKKIDVNNTLLTKIAPEGLPEIENNNQNNCG